MIAVTDTAAAVARVRAAESVHPPAERLFDDPYARLFTGGAAVDEAAALFHSVPFFPEGIRLRTRFIDDLVRQVLADGMRDIVILGAGFDCRALRLPEIAAAGARVFEVDFEGQLAVKRRALSDAGVRLPPHLHLVPCDLSASDLEDRLAQHLAGEGFRRPALFIWEGVTSYLTDVDIDRSLRWMASTGGPGSRLVFNYNIARLDPYGVRTRVFGAGFLRLTDETFDAVYRRLLPGKPPPGGDLYHIVVAER